MVMEAFKKPLAGVKGFATADYGVVSIGGVAGAWGSTILGEFAVAKTGLTGVKGLLARVFTKIPLSGILYYLGTRATNTYAKLGLFGMAIGATISAGIDVLKYAIGKTPEQQGLALAMKLGGAKSGASVAAKVTVGEQMLQEKKKEEAIVP